MPPPAGLIELVEHFRRNIDDYRSGSYNETQVRREFVDPFFKLLGWDIDNEAGIAEQYKDVVHEDSMACGLTEMFLVPPHGSSARHFSYYSFLSIPTITRYSMDILDRLRASMPGSMESRA